MTDPESAPRPAAGGGLPPPADEGDEAGFTLVEVLVAVTLLSLLSMALFSSVRFGVTAWQRGTERADQIHTSMAVQEVLRRLIGEAYPLLLSDGAGNGLVDFAGTATSLDFLAPVPVALASGGRARFTLAIDRHGDLSDLVLTSRPELADGDAKTGLQRKTVLATIEAADFSYFAVGTRGAVARPLERRDDASGPGSRSRPVRPQRSAPVARPGDRAAHHRRRRLRLRSAHQAVPGALTWR
jgi:general secretion pathway protein J